MATQKPDSLKPVATATPDPAPRSEALETELAMLESILPPDTKQPAPVDAPKDRRRGDTR